MDERRDPHSGPVPDEAWSADASARKRGRVEVFNATRPGGMDGWTMDVRQYDLMRCHILSMIDHECGDWFQDIEWESGRPQHTDKGREFKTSFHAGRALIRVADAVEAIV